MFAYVCKYQITNWSSARTSFNNIFIISFKDPSVIWSQYSYWPVGNGTSSTGWLNRRYYTRMHIYVYCISFMYAILLVLFFPLHVMCFVFLILRSVLCSHIHARLRHFRNLVPGMYWWSKDWGSPLKNAGNRKIQAFI